MQHGNRIPFVVIFLENLIGNESVFFQCFFLEKKHETHIHLGNIGNNPNHPFLFCDGLREAFPAHYPHIIDKDIAYFFFYSPKSKIRLYFYRLLQLFPIDETVCQEQFPRLHEIPLALRKKKKFLAIDEIEGHKHFSEKHGYSPFSLRLLV